jgi:uncharacterized damage-inducible protein DinB
VDKTRASLDLMSRTADELWAAIEGQSDLVLARRPASGAWAATEVICHLRDVEEFYLGRAQLILANDEPRLPMLDPDQWAEERQYLRNDACQALAAFRRRRNDTLKCLAGLMPAQWERGGLHPLRDRVTVRNIAHALARHDQIHLDQLRRALKGLT